MCGHIRDTGDGRCNTIIGGWSTIKVVHTYCMPGYNYIRYCTMRCMIWAVDDPESDNISTRTVEFGPPRPRCRSINFKIYRDKGQVVHCPRRGKLIFLASYLSRLTIHALASCLGTEILDSFRAQTKGNKIADTIHILLCIPRFSMSNQRLGGLKPGSPPPPCCMKRSACSLQEYHAAEYDHEGSLRMGTSE